MITMIVSFVIVIGILILIHELGHFFVARAVGVGVERSVTKVRVITTCRPRNSASPAASC